MSKIDFLDAVKVETPCSESWDEMKGDKQVKFCSHCAKDVHNLSEMTPEKARRLVSRSKGGICIRYTRRPDGKIQTLKNNLSQITRQTGITAGVLGVSMTASTLAYAQTSEAKPAEPEIKIVRLQQSGYFDPVDKEKPEERHPDSGTSIISGVITDANGAIVPNVTVTLKEKTSDVTKSAATNADGAYEFTNIAAGTYSLKTEVTSGFKNLLVENIELAENESKTENLVMETGQIYMSMGIMAMPVHRNLLHSAVADDDLEEVKNLIAKGEKINGKDRLYDNITPLFIAVENGNLKIAETLLEFGAKVNARDKNKETPLMRLDADASAELASLLINRGAQINWLDADGNSALIAAAGSAKAEVLEVLTKNGADVNLQNKEGRTALMQAAEADNLEGVKALVLAGADVNLKDKEGETAWDLTSSDKIEDFLESYGAAVEKDDTETPQN